MSDLATLTPRQLAWLRFKRHRLAMVSGAFLLAIYAAAFVCDFIITPMSSVLSGTRLAHRDAKKAARAVVTAGRPV